MLYVNSDKNHYLSEDVNSDLSFAQQLVYGPSGFTITHIKAEKESADYGAFDFELNGRRCKFRVGKITPKKIEFFVTLWKRLDGGPIIPYDLAYPVDFFVFSVFTQEYLGLFIFPKRFFSKKE